MQNVEPILVVHGGAGAIPDYRILVKLKGVRRAARKGYKVLLRSGSVLNAIVAAVEVMEEDTNFNAGTVFIRFILALLLKLITSQ